MSPKTYAFFISLTAALGGFLFGFDTAVISGAERAIQEVWKLNDWVHGLAIASALYGTVIGALLGGIPAEKMGRKKSLLWIGLFYFISAVGSGIAWDVTSFTFFRFLGGLGVGASSVVAPMYISEIAPAKSRGLLVALYQFNIVFGIVMAYVSNYWIGTAGIPEDWRWMLGVEAIPAILYTLLIFKIPESPRWLITKFNDLTQARAILTRTDPEGVEETLRLAIAESQSSTTKQATGFGVLFRPQYLSCTLLAIAIAFFNQVSGINFILYYAPEILERAGLAAKDSLFNSIAIGGTNLLFTFVGLYLIDRLGRKTLLIIGSLGYIISLSMVSWAFYAAASPAFLLSFLLVFIASHAIGQGAVIWVFIAEIFPNKIRALGQSFGASVHWVFAALITLITPVFLDAGDGIFKDNPWPIFAFFAGMMALQLIWVFVKVPETKGVSLEKLEEDLVKP